MTLERFLLESRDFSLVGEKFWPIIFERKIIFEFSRIWPMGRMKKVEYRPIRSTIGLNRRKGPGFFLHSWLWVNSMKI